MKSFKVVIIVFVVTVFIFGCSSKNLSGTYATLPYQNQSGIILFLYSDSTFRYIKLRDTRIYNVESESAGKWIRYNNAVVLNSTKLAYDSMKLFNYKHSHYNQLTNHTLIIKRKKLIDTSQTNMDIRVFRKTTSKTEISSICPN